MLVALAAFHRARGTLGLVATATSAGVALLVAARLSRLYRRARSLHADSPAGPAKAEAKALLAAQVVALAAAAREPCVQREAPVQREPDRRPDQPELAKPARRSVHSVQFDQRVACILVRDLTDAPPERKAEFWWRQADFDEFLRVRLQVGKAYRDAAKKIGVDVMQVSSVGTHGDEGYRAMIASMPELANESRRGLGLGRKRQRAKNRDAYIAAVLDEQRRQREEAEDDDTPGRPFRLNADSIARAAQRISEKDLKYAHFLAQRYYEQDRAAEDSDDNEAQERAEPHDSSGVPSGPWPARRQLGTARARFEAEAGAPPADSSWDEAEAPGGLLWEDALLLRDEAETSAGILLGQKAAPRASKGFGLSLDRLKEVGLTATGHALSRQKQLHAGVGAGVLSDDSDITAGESEDDCPRRKGIRPRSNSIGEGFRSAAGDLLSSQKTDTKTYGSRNHYRNWRVWAKATSGDRTSP